MTGCGKIPFCGKKIVAMIVVWAGLMSLPAAVSAQTPAEEASTDLAALLTEQNQNLSRELRRIQREIAALRSDLDKPDLQDVFSGIGYIIGLFGVAAFMAARRRDRRIDRQNNPKNDQNNAPAGQ